MKPNFYRFLPAPTEGLKPSQFTAADAFTTRDKKEINHFFYSSDDENILAGVWECAPCKEVFEAYPVNEMMTVVSGSVTLSHPESATTETFVAGDSFFIAKGAPCVWEITETLKKYYFISS